ncbi:AAA family ATPase [Halomonas sp. BN3-1]|uniref:ATP-dependent nuclease n=1 Tax=Halomonas sp. BN3-1 TaxID=2082393 RepID=UPI000D3CF7B8|nr:AAA family ATPase [Halomonas sp. BN3-1]
MALKKENVTRLKSFHINIFRGLSDIDIDFADRITLICGKNGTSKSTILGIAAQIFSFSKDYSKSPVEVLDYKNLNDRAFKSAFKEHFRFSSEYDKPGNMDIDITVHDGAFRREINGLKLGLTDSSDRSKARPVLRKNIPAAHGSGNTSRNVTHPVIYLSLSRLIPISQRVEYSKRNIDYLNSNDGLFKELCSDILNKGDIVKATATDGDLRSAVAHGNDYDQDSVSVGEDNVGQLVLALLSFKQLSENYPNYHGGLLLIDEADAGLFPAAQKNLIRILSEFSKTLSLQVVMTSHSPTMIDAVKYYSDRDQKNFKTIYLTNAYGKVAAKPNWGWDFILADMESRALSSHNSKSRKKINVYFEDREASDFFDKLVRKRDVRSHLSLKKTVKLSSEAYRAFIKEKVEEFSKNSIVVFDGDVPNVAKYKNCLSLPGGYPPDQLVFKVLMELPKDDDYWKNELLFTKDAFTQIARKLIRRLNIAFDEDNNEIDLASKIESCKTGRPIREDFKELYKTDTIQALLKKQSTNPFCLWISRNPADVSMFNEELTKTLKKVYLDVHKRLTTDLNNL